MPDPEGDPPAAGATAGLVAGKASIGGATAGLVAGVAAGVAAGGPAGEHAEAPAGPAERIVVSFARLLRAAGLDVPAGAVVAFAQALGAVGLERRDAVYWAGRATLLRRPEDRQTYDRAFAEFFEEGARAVRAQSEPPLTLLLDSEEESSSAEEQDGREAGDDASLVVRYSALEVLRHQDFAAFSDADWAEARVLMSRLRLPSELRVSRRARRSKARHGRPDVPRTVRRALATDGEPLNRAWRAPSTRSRRVVYLVDISGSMQPYARAFLRLAHAAVSARPVGAVEVFVFGTRLTRITRQLSWRDPDAALAEAASVVADWYGGTRLGDSVRAFNDRWGSRGIARGAVVVILSDGWDRGDPADLGSEMARLHRMAERIIWVNPLKASPGYTPAARGMAAALPFLDEFVEGESIASLEALATTLGGRRAAGRARAAQGGPEPRRAAGRRLAPPDPAR